MPPRTPSPHRHTVDWSVPALADVDAIETFVAQAAPAAARRLRHELVTAGDSLALFPMRGRILDGEIRKLVIAGRYVLRYRIAGTRVQILGLRDGRRDVV